MTGAAWTLPGYGVERLLGFGSTGEVWRAHELDTGEVVALKRVRLGTSAPRVQAPERLRREAALLAAVSHPHLLRLRQALTTREGLVLVLDYAAGGTLADVLRVRGPISAGEVVTMAGPLADALAAAHRQGVVHGDVTPGNVLFTADGRPLLADLGMGRLIGEAGRPVEGTAGYVDPRVLAGAEPNAASDVYGLAAVCYRALTGQSPAAPTSRWGRRPASPSLAQLAAQPPPGLVAVIEAALARSPRSRPDAASFASRLAAAAPAAPVRLTAGHDRALPRPGGRVDADLPGPADEDDLLTSAIRPGPGAGSTGPPAPTGGRAVRRRLARAGSTGSSPLRGKRRRASSGYLGAAVAVVVLTLAVAGGWKWGRATPTPAGHLAAGSATASPAASVRPVAKAPAPSPTSAAIATPTTPTPTAAGTTAPATASAAGPPAPDGQRWQAVLVGLDGRRSAAFAEADPAVLAEVYVPGSAPYAADVAAVTRLQATGSRVRLLRHDVRAVRLLERTVDGATVELTDQLPAYEICDANGAVLSSDPGRGVMSWRVQLVAVADGWRIENLQAA